MVAAVVVAVDGDLGQGAEREVEGHGAEVETGTGEGIDLLATGRGLEDSEWDIPFWQWHALPTCF